MAKKEKKEDKVVELKPATVIEMPTSAKESNEIKPVYGEKIK